MAQKKKPLATITLSHRSGKLSEKNWKRLLQPKANAGTCVYTYFYGVVL